MVRYGGKPQSAARLAASGKQSVPISLADAARLFHEKASLGAPRDALSLKTHALGAPRPEMLFH